MLDTKMAELQQIVDPEDFVSESVDIDIDMDEASEAVPAGFVEPVVQELPIVHEQSAAPEPLASSIDEDLPESIFSEPEVVTVAAKAKTVARPSINDVMADTCAWRHDMPGAHVRDIRSAISLNDRVIFINLLFGEDAQMFVNTLAQINTMETLDQAVEYLSAQFPSWDMNSDLVYRFMMAVRRKVK